MAKTQDQVLADLTKALKDLTKTTKDASRKSSGISDLADSLKYQFSYEPLVDSLGKVTNTLLQHISPLNAMIEGAEKSDQFQKKALLVNSNLKNFLGENSEALKGLRGGFFENAEELLENFTQGIRFNSKDLNVLQNRMKLTGQSTELLRRVTKQLIGSTNSNSDSIGKLSKTNMELGRTYMIANEDLLQALDRNSETMDFASLFDEGEKTGEALMNLTAQMTSKGIEVKKQDQIIKFLADQTVEGVQTRQKLGISVDVLDQIANGQTTLEQVLGQVSGFAKQNLIATQGAYKKQATDIALQGLGDGIKQVVIASNQVNSALRKPDNELKNLQSKEDKYYDTYETSVKEAKNFYEKTAAEFYDVMKPTPQLLEGIQRAMIGAQVGGAVGSLATGAAGLMKETSKFGKILGSVGMLAGPIGALAGIGIPMLMDGIEWFFSESEEQKAEREKQQGLATLQIAKDFQASIQNSNQLIGVLGNITSADKQVNDLRQQLINTQQTQIADINRMMDSVKKTNDQQLISEFEKDAAAQINAINRVIEQGHQSNLGAEELRRLNQQASNSSNKFLQGIQENSKFTSIHLKDVRDNGLSRLNDNTKQTTQAIDDMAKNGIQVTPKKEPKPDENAPKKVERRNSLEDLLHQALGRALGNSTPKKEDNKSNELLKELQEANRLNRMMYDADRRNKSVWAGA